MWKVIHSGLCFAKHGDFINKNRLARMGYAVEVFDPAEGPGGKLNELWTMGYRFDAGPSLFTLPELVHELLDEDLRFAVRQLPVITRYFWDDGVILDAHADVTDLCEEVERITGVSSSDLKDYLDDAAEVYKITAPVFIFNSLHKWKTLARRNNLPALFGLYKLNAFTSLHDFNRKKLVNERLVQLFDRYATYNGSDPYKTPATLRVIAHLEHNLGAWLPEGGMYTIVRALMNQAQRLNVTFNFNQPVTGVVAVKKQVTGITSGKGFHPADIVVSGVDIRYFYTHLLPDQKKLRKLARQQLSSSALIFYWGVRGTSPQLDVHNIFFSGDYRQEFKDLFENKTISTDPTIYVYVSSKLFREDAPEQCENWFVMVNAPENRGQNWQEMVSSARKAILGKLERMISASLEDRIEAEEILDPLKIEEKTGSWHGSLYGPSSNSRISAFQRHANFSSQIDGLYFTGGSVHPGGGIPLCLSSAKIVASLIQERYDNNVG
jgi:diapolycopene oxygenase